MTCLCCILFLQEEALVIQSHTESAEECAPGESYNIINRKLQRGAMEKGIVLHR